MTRRDMSALTREEFDALIVGGGIVGVGIARDLALRGLRVAIVERGDWAGGTTSRPTRLIHGGLRYLETLDFGLVRADMREREVLLRIAPHLVTPRPFLLPIYRRSPVYRAKLWTGMRLYDLLSYDKSLPGRGWLDRAALLAAEPSLEPAGLRGAWRFYDAQVALVERLALETLLDARAHGAVALNYATAERFLRHDDRVLGAEVRLEEGERCLVRARVTINATGPWLDLTSGALRPHAPPLLRLTKGVHLVTPAATRQAHVLFARSDARLFFVVPWLGCSLVGTTDTDYHGDPTDAAADARDVAYLLNEAARAFPGAPFGRIHYTMAGVRALARVEGIAEGRVSRKHLLHDHLALDGVQGVVSVAGGKLTAYRAIAEDVGDLVVRRLGRGARASTAWRALPGADPRPAATRAEAAALAVRAGLSAQTLDHLLALYGRRALEVLELAARDRGLAAPLAGDGPDVLAQVAHAAETEQALHLADLLLRRSTIGLAPRQGLDDLDALLESVGAVLGWSEERRQAERARYLDEIAPMRRFASPPRAAAEPAA